VPEPPEPISFYADFFSESGAGGQGLFDYWRDVSYGNIDLTGSRVFGWYTMRYSFVRDGKDPLRNGTVGRTAWVAEGRRLAIEAGVDLSRYYDKICTIVNAAVDGGATGGDYSGSHSGPWGQGSWRWCRNCHVLHHVGTATAAGVCPARSSAPHDFTGSLNYALPLNMEDAPGQAGWRYCSICAQLVFGPDRARPVAGCPGGPTHTLSHDGRYTVMHGVDSYPGQEGWRYCSQCNGLVHGHEVPCGGGATHSVGGSGTYWVHSTVPGLQLFYNAHESGHGYDLSHANSAVGDVEYGDPWDVMGRAFTFPGRYMESGPGLTGPHLDRLGWLSPDRIVTWDSRRSATRTVTLTPLSRRAATGAHLAKVVTRDRVYTVEFRTPDGWDRGLPRARPAVVIHELRTLFSVGQRQWRYCSRCRTLAYGGASSCAAGGTHDVSRSGDYTLFREGSALAQGQPGWRHCSRCQGIVHEPGGPAPCPAGGSHILTSSARYVLHTAPREGTDQPDWQFCNRCRSLVFNRPYRHGPVRMACAAGGVHDFGGSGSYFVSRADRLSPTDAATGQSSWRWCRKCQGLTYGGGGGGLGACAAPHGGGVHDFTASRDYSVALDPLDFPGQSGWRFCAACSGLIFPGGNGPAQCANGGRHLPSASNYALSMRGTFRGQDGWRHCSQCTGLVHQGNDPSTGWCSVGGTHQLGPTEYTLADDANIFVVQRPTGETDWQAGDQFTPADRRWTIRVESMDVAVPQATVLLRAAT
jgi:hypothetical protein